MTNKKGSKHLTKEERYIIYEMRQNKAGYQEIADKIGKSKSAVCTEFNRNRTNNKYLPCEAHEKYRRRLTKSDTCKIDQCPELFDYIVYCLKYRKWSPDAIAGRIRLENNLPNISTETIYHYIYNSPKSIEMGLYKYLPRKQSCRKKQGTGKRKKLSIPGRVSIHQRPNIAIVKKEPGHFEGDLTFHKGNQSSNIGAIVDILSQKIFLTFNSSKKSEIVISSFLDRIKSIPKKMRKSLTLDNGKEFTEHERINKSFMKTYFCDSYSPQQKPLVEKMNSMIHRIFPKNIDITTLTKYKLNKIEKTLNNMPRKSLNYKTPNEIWNEYVAI